ncbi:MAG: Mrp/NBP35 family ATP-binding protein [Chloroflexi bacterium]|nr:Mrp/NBP35 family ATP-binding protein [Chloroflexota bacterium]
MSEQKLTTESILAALSDVKDPGLDQNLVSKMLIQDIKVEHSQVRLTVVLISPLHPYKNQIEQEVRAAIESIDGVEKVVINFSVEVPTDGRKRGSDPIKNVVAIASGKGGVGKSTVSVNLAVALAQTGVKVGLMDADVYGPNVPLMMGVENVRAGPSPEGRITPIMAHGVKLMSIGFMVPPDQPIVWRGPMLHSAIQQFVNDVHWGELDYLFVDLPPGTGDAQLSLAQTVSVSGGVIITLPQQVSLDDARRGLELFKTLNIPLMGIVENMSYLELPDGEKMDVFGSGGGEKLGKVTGVPFIGGIPIDPAVRIGGDNGMPIVLSQPESAAAKMFMDIAADIALKTSVIAMSQKSQAVPISMVN